MAALPFPSRNRGQGFGWGWICLLAAKEKRESGKGLKEKLLSHPWLKMRMYVCTGTNNKESLFQYFCYTHTKFEFHAGNSSPSLPSSYIRTLSFNPFLSLLACTSNMLTTSSSSKFPPPQPLLFSWFLLLSSPFPIRRQISERHPSSPFLPPPPPVSQPRTSHLTPATEEEV